MSLTLGLGLDTSQDTSPIIMDSRFCSKSTNDSCVHKTNNIMSINNQVACVDGDGQLTGSAKKFDQELEATVAKIKSRNGSTRIGEEIHPSSMSGPVHVMKLEVLFLESGSLSGCE